MLVSAQLAQVPTVDRLVKLWADRYLPDLFALPLGEDPSTLRKLREASSAAGRSQTAMKLHEHLVDENCKLAVIRTQDLYTYLADVLDIKEAIRLSKFAAYIHLKLLEVYQESPPILASSTEQLRATFGDSSLAAWGIPKIEKLADTLEPLLLQFQEQHIISKDWRTLGFITTQINFSNRLLLQQLTPVEQVLIGPYFNFLEEQVAIPWQRVCAAAARYELDSPIFGIVETMMPIASDIALTVYNRLLKSFPAHYSRRGRLDASPVQHSCLRDLTMFQAYLWLCVLQGDLKAVEQELVALCIMVMESVGVGWEMTARWNEFLMEEIVKHLDPSQKSLVQPYADGMIKAFYYKRTRFGATC